MSILIKGMEMPFAGSIKTIVIYPDGTVRTRRQDPLPYTAITVPPHGRLGDLDEIVRYKERLVVDADKIKKEIRYVVDTKYIKESPTIVPASEEGE